MKVYANDREVEVFESATAADAARATGLKCIPAAALGRGNIPAFPVASPSACLDITWRPE